jgi:hypothetical protein
LNRASSEINGFSELLQRFERNPIIATGNLSKKKSFSVENERTHCLFLIFATENVVFKHKTPYPNFRKFVFFTSKI